MFATQQPNRQGPAAAELHKHCEHRPPDEIVDSLMVGMKNIRDLFLTRVHEDVERHFGSDSMIISLSPGDDEKHELRAKFEIEAYSSIVAADEVSQNRYVEEADKWFLPWIFQLRLGDRPRSVLDKRVEFYRSESIEARRLKFVSILQRVMPESAKTPLVLFRLYPRAVRIVTAVAFGDVLRAQELRLEQSKFLPAVGDCHECHGRVLDNEEICSCCCNPVWKFDWLCSD